MIKYLVFELGCSKSEKALKWEVNIYLHNEEYVKPGTFS